MPYAEVWRMAIEGGNLLARIEPISLAGGLSFLCAGADRRRSCGAAPVAPPRRRPFAALIRAWPLVPTMIDL